MAVANLSSGASIAQVTPRVTRGITQAMLNSPSKMVQPQANNSRSSIGQLQFPEDLPKYYFGLSIDKYSRSSPFSFNVTLNSKIKLPLPKQLVDSDSVLYEQQELNAIGGAALAAGAAGKDLLEGDIKSAAGNILQAGMGSLGQGAINLAEAAGGEIFKNIFDAGKALTGVAPNQFTTVLLKGPTYKKHEFSWTLSPKNVGESNSIKKIIKELKKSMLVGNPGLLSLGFFQPAQIFTPHFFTNESYLYKFKPCVLENMSVNYTPSGAPAFYTSTGAPDAIELRLSFLEVEFWFKEDFS